SAPSSMWPVTREPVSSSMTRPASAMKVLAWPAVTALEVVSMLTVLLLAWVRAMPGTRTSPDELGRGQQDAADGPDLAALKGVAAGRRGELVGQQEVAGSLVGWVGGGERQGRRHQH